MGEKSAIPRAAAVSRIKREWKGADEVRFEGKCPDCKRQDTLWSFQVETDHPTDNGQETCGFWCSACKYSKAGVRQSIDVEQYK